MLPAAHRRVLRVIAERLGAEPIVWALTGSTSFALQGVPVEPHDIDLQTDEAGAYTIERLLAEYRSHPVCFVESERMRSHLGALVIDDLTVEIMGAVQKRMPDGSWEPPVDVATYRRFVELNGLQIPVLSLAYERRAYELLGRGDRASLLARYVLTDHTEGADTQGE